MSIESERAQVEIRLAGLPDAPAIAAVLRAAFEEYRPLYTEEAFAATTPAAEQVEARMLQGPVWVATRRGEIVGTVAAASRGEDFYIRGMGILPSARGLRIGALLLEAIHDTALAGAHRRLILSTTPFLDRAIRLYESFGFQCGDEGPHELFGTPLFTMTRSLL